MVNESEKEVQRAELTKKKYPEYYYESNREKCLFFNNEFVWIEWEDCS